MYYFDLKVVSETVVPETGGNTQETQTQTDPGPLNDQETEEGSDDPAFVIEQDHSQEECQYCLSPLHYT
jgi:hypothetical protein